MSILKRVSISFMAVVMAIFACFSLTGCIEDIKRVELKIQVYNYADNGAFEDYTMNIDLYRHLAPNTVDAIVKYVNDKHYDGTVFYKLSNTSYSSQYMIGELVEDEGQFKLNAIQPQLGKGEFEYGGTIGSNLTNKKGAVGLWRSWYETDDEFKTSSDATGSGRATWFMPTSEISKYNKWMCVFGQYDVSAENNANTLTALSKAFSTGNYESYVVYYTGEYNAETPDAGDGYGLTGHIVASNDFVEDDIEDLFTAEGKQLECYNHYTIQVPVAANGAVAAKIVSAKIV